MGIFDWFKNKTADMGAKLPDNLNSPEEIARKAKELAESKQEMVEEVSEQIKNAIPGQADDKLIDNVNDKLTNG